MRLSNQTTRRRIFGIRFYEIRLVHICGSCGPLDYEILLGHCGFLIHGFTSIHFVAKRELLDSRFALDEAVITQAFHVSVQENLVLPMK